VSHGASLVITETETEGLDKDVFEYIKLTKYLLYLLSSHLLEANLVLDITLSHTPHRMLGSYSRNTFPPARGSI